MGSLFRSEEMTLCQLFLQTEAAYACVSELGELGLVQFRDLNPDVNAFQRKFVNEVRRCDEMERKLRYLEKEIKKDGIPMLDTGENPEAPQPREMIDLEATFEKLENELREVNHNAEALKKNFLELTELKHILRKTQVFFDEVDQRESYHSAQMTDPSREEEHVSLLGEEGLRAGGQQALKLGYDFKSKYKTLYYYQSNNVQEGGFHPTESMTRALITDDSNARQAPAGPVQLGFVAGVILRERIPSFERMLWRACRGNVFLRQTEIDSPLEDPSTGDKVLKSVFIIFFQGDQLKTRVKKICEGFRATLYPSPETPADRREMAMGVMTRIEDLNTVLGQTQDHRHRVLVAAAKNVKNWFVKVRKIKAIYHTLNLFNLDVTQKCLIAECWVPLLDTESIQLALRRGTERSGSSVPPILNRMETFEDPPTYNRTNKFTNAFQNLIDAYGVANYREVNPTPYTIITFPFLFAVMFGDLGHGVLMFLFAAWMVWKEKPLMAKKSTNEIWNIFFGGRYIVLLMGAFSMYTGLIYNDIFSKSLNVFGTHWQVSNITRASIEPDWTLDPATNDYIGTPYPFGLDPVWQLASNKIVYLNSYKLKISIIFGVIHMLFGVVLSYNNYTYFKKPLNVYCDFIPQIIFLTFLFFYMVMLMFIKWISYGPKEPFENGPGCAPSILITFINMILMNEAKVLANCGTVYMFTGQAFLQKILLFVAAVCVPWMLFAKPVIIMREQKQQHEMQLASNHMPGEGSEADGHVVTINNVSHPPARADEHEDLSELFIHQAIHTIEYVLGSVSHSASYLRLWALSLAHAQLSEVLWTMLLRNGLQFESWVGGVVLWAIFSLWATFTVGILVLMEGLSAFLHTLRLHWVEFQSKFYSGTGYIFQPFSFEIILATASAAIEE